MHPVVRTPFQQIPDANQQWSTEWLYRQVHTTTWSFLSGCQAKQSWDHSQPHMLLWCQHQA